MIVRNIAVFTYSVLHYAKMNLRNFSSKYIFEYIWNSTDLYFETMNCYSTLDFNIGFFENVKIIYNLELEVSVKLPTPTVLNCTKNEVFH